MSEYNIQMNKYNALNAEYDQLYPQPMKHANTHAKDGSDPITPASIGAYTKGETDTLLAKKAEASAVSSHISNKSNPHDVTAEQVGSYTKEKTNDLLMEKPNPHLEDNGYFANPVDQRGGYVVPPGTTYYYHGSDTVAGTTSAYYTVKSVDTNGNSAFYIDGTEYWCVGKGVRGYTGAGYGIDRWNLITGTLLIRSNGICLYNAFLDEYFDEDLTKCLVGKTITISALTSGGLCSATAVIPENLQTEVNFVSVGFNNGSISAIWSIDGKLTFRIYAAQSGAELYAVKMEIGTQQTLAHQENGVWVLNEIPDYDVEFLKCIQSTADPSDNYANKKILHSGNAQTLGFPKIAIGSYVGTGTSDAYGGTQQNSLTFDFEPKMLAVVADGANSFFAGFLIVRGQTYSDGIGSFEPSSVGLNLHITWSGNTVSWWSSNRIDVGTKYPQMNAENTTYRYVALG